MVCTSVFYFKSLIIRLFTTCLMYIKYPWCLVLYTLFLPPKIATAYMACEQHLHGSRTTLARLKPLTDIVKQGQTRAWKTY